MEKATTMESVRSYGKPYGKLALMMESPTESTVGRLLKDLWKAFSND